MSKIFPRHLYSILFQNRNCRSTSDNDGFQLERDREILRQARLSHRVFCFLIGASVFVTLTGAVLLFMGKATEGALATAAGGGAGSACSQLCSDAKSKLEILTKARDADDDP